ncbi:MAG: hypothetical protein U0996_07670 [Planctomycetaceae bacterium]
MSGSESLLDSNPYSAPKSLMEEVPAGARDVTETLQSPLTAGLEAWATTGLAGGFFGLMLAGFFGAVIGLLIAFITALPVAAMIVIVLYFTCPAGVTSRAALWASVVCGAVSGFGSTTLLFGKSSVSIALIAGFTGAGVSALGTALIHWNKKFGYPAEPLPPDGQRGEASSTANFMGSEL